MATKDPKLQAEKKKELATMRPEKHEPIKAPDSGVKPEPFGKKNPAHTLGSRTVQNHRRPAKTHV